MSLDARFTQLRRSMERGRPGIAEKYQRPSPRERVSSLKNHLLAMEIAERPHVMAALSRGRSRVRRGSMNNGNVMPLGRSRSPFPGRSRSRQRAGSIRRSNSLGRLGRSMSVQSLMSIGDEGNFNVMQRVRNRRGGGAGRGGFKTRIFTRGSRVNPRGGIQKLNMDLVASASRRKRSASLSRLGNAPGGVGGFKRGRGRRGRDISDGGNIKSRLGVRPASLNRTGSVGNPNVRGRSRSRTGAARGGLQGRIGAVGRGGAGKRGGARSASNARRGGMIQRSPNKNRGGFKGNNPKGRAAGGNRGRRGAGGTRGRGAARGGRGRGGKPKPPTKEELDNELDSYMSNTRSYLDKQLDQYMAAPPTTA